MPESLKRVAYSPAEFAGMFGKSQTWGYRQIYAGKVKTITQHGRILIPAADVERILAEAGIYNGEKKRAAKVVSNAEVWGRLVAGRKVTQRNDGNPKRSATLARLRPATAKDGKGAKARLRKP